MNEENQVYFVDSCPPKHLPENTVWSRIRLSALII